MPTKASTLVRVVMETLGAEGPTALARELGMTDYSAPRKIADWLEGKYAPNYEATILMLERSGLLNLEAHTRQGTTPDPSPLSPRQRCLLAATEAGYRPEALATIFSTPQDEIEAELQAARDELAHWQETHAEQAMEPSGQPLTPLSLPSLGKSTRISLNLDGLYGEPGEETEEETGELTLETIERELKEYREAIEASTAQLKASTAQLEAFQAHLQERFDRIRAQTTHTPGKDAE